MTPNDIEILIHCHLTRNQHPRAQAPAVQEALLVLEDNGLIEQLNGGGYITTDRGKAHIQQLCNLPWPVWASADGKVIEPND